MDDESNLAGISNIHDGFLSRDLQHMVFQFQHRAQELQYAFENISNSPSPYLPLALWPTEPQALLGDVTSFHTALVLAVS